MSDCSRKCNELKKRLDEVSYYSDDFIYSKLLDIDLIIDEILNYTKEDILNGTCFKDTVLGEIIKESIKKRRKSKWGQSFIIFIRI